MNMYGRDFSSASEGFLDEKAEVLSDISGIQKEQRVIGRAEPITLSTCYVTSVHGLHVAAVVAIAAKPKLR